MSLYRTALRALTVLALRAETPSGALRTLAGPHVYDSRNDPLDEIARGAPQPIIAVYTDEDAAQAGVRRDVSLVIEYAVNVRDRIDGEEAVWVPQTDDGLELTLDIVELEIRAALAADASPAAALWQRLVTDRGEDVSRRAVLDPDKAARLAARQLIWKLRLLPDPPAGGPLPPLLADIFALLEADPHYGPAVPMLRAIAGRDAGRADHWRAVQRLHLDRSSAYKLRLVPASGPGGKDGNDQAPALGLDGQEVRDDR